jgi:uncharacterized protein YqgC (DUF456 family)
MLIYWVLIAIMLVGVIGAVIPILPGSSLILLAIIVWGIVTHSFAVIEIPVIVAIIVLILSTGIDFLGGYLGAQQFGASKWGQIGSIVGLLCGFFGLLPTLPFGGPAIGVLLGPLLGAIIGELLYQRKLYPAVKAGIGIFVGTFVGDLIEGLLAVVAVIVFLIATWSQVYGS